MPIAESPTDFLENQPFQKGLRVPAIPLNVTHADPPVVILPVAESAKSISPQRLNSPQAMETVLVRLENQRQSRQQDEPAPQQEIESRISKIRQSPSGYRPLHLCYHTSRKGNALPYADANNVLDLSSMLWRLVWIMCLVCTGLAVIVWLFDSFIYL